jgi:hypothetical protein
MTSFPGPPHVVTLALKLFPLAGLASRHPSVTA